ncbi:MAG: ankyrin repeat domain-containing protein [Synergistaceae bacterium]|jgi:hypothetical protein|nr:ankyrin repeat domain-containing protein [Synergistaceae bacterium]
MKKFRDLFSLLRSFAKKFGRKRGDADDAAGKENKEDGNAADSKPADDRPADDKPSDGKPSDGGATVRSSVRARRKRKKSAKNTAIIALFGTVALLASGVLLLTLTLRDSGEESLSKRALRQTTEMSSRLVTAVRNNDVSAALKLISNGASPSFPDQSGMTAIKTAIVLNREVILNELLKAMAANIDYEDSPLIYAIVQNKPNLIPVILAYWGKELNRLDKNGYPPLMYAIDRNLLAVAKALLVAGANPNRPDRRGRTPLIAAVRIGRPDMVELLLDAGADWRITSTEGDTPLEIALDMNRNLVVALLLERGAK